MIRPLACALTAACIVATASAEGAGEVTLDIEGETYAFPLWESQSDWSGSESYASVNIYARPTDKETWSKFKTFTLGFETMGSNISAPEARLTRMVNGDQQRLFAGEDQDEGGLKVTVDSTSVTGDALSITGSFVAQMGPSDNFGRDIDLSDPVEITGRFDVKLGPVE
ncbi:MAG: hypothetical protein RIB03_12570 [Henriciella sp.]|uniref:hypothetical protein n=1 Tax=Henriciella sp. TaxID=1968823 RepID=UPI0032EF2228